MDSVIGLLICDNGSKGGLDVGDKTSTCMFVVSDLDGGSTLSVYLSFAGNEQHVDLCSRMTCSVNTSPVSSARESIKFGRGCSRNT